MTKFKDISNKQFGKILAIRYDHSNEVGDAVWECRCLECNNIVFVVGGCLRSGNTTQCLSCSRKNKKEKTLLKSESLVGTIINNRKLIKLLSGRGTTSKYLCQCLLCGKKYATSFSSIQSTRACRCIHLNNKAGLKHGLNGTPFYKSWAAIKERCYNPNCSRYKNYGNRGIILCEEWKNFINFHKDMIISYNKFKEQNPGITPTIDRIDVDGNYEPKNCRWLSRTENNKNTQRHKKLSQL